MINRIPGHLLELAHKIVSRAAMFTRRPLFRKYGINVRFGSGCDFSFANIEIGDDVYIGPGATFSAAISTIRIGSKVLFGPGVTIMGGDHRTNVVGVAMHDVVDKLSVNDQDVSIGDDVWIGAKAVILKGVQIGRGSVVGAGSVVTKSVPPYSVVVGNPAKVIRARFSADEIETHERALNGK